jgi:hypothetical protein
MHIFTHCLDGPTFKEKYEENLGKEATEYGVEGEFMNCSISKRQIVLLFKPYIRPTEGPSRSHMSAILAYTASTHQENRSEPVSILLETMRVAFVDAGHCGELAAVYFTKRL